MLKKTGLILLLSLELASCGGSRPTRPSGATGAYSGNAGGGNGSKGGSPGLPGTIDPITGMVIPSDPTKKRIFRLTQTQFDETIKFILPAYPQKSISTFLAADPKQTNYDYADYLNFNSANFTPYSQWVSTIAASVAADPTKLIACPIAPPAAACHKDAATQFVTRAFRGAADPATITVYVNFFVNSFAAGTLASATSDLVSSVLMSPNFNFRAEFTTDAKSILLPGEYRQNLAYTLADAPLEELIGTGLTAPGTTELIDKAMASKLVRAKLQRFVTDWLEIKKPSEFRMSPELFPEFTDVAINEALAETGNFINYYVSQPTPRLADLVTSRKSFYTAGLKAFYAADEGKGLAAEHDPKKRMGVFTQPAFIASRSGPIEANIVKRGVFFMRKGMCMDTGMFPPNTDTKAPTTGKTERQIVEEKTKNAPCSGCHTKINPFGASFENYDPIGRWRATEHDVAITSSVTMDFLGDAGTTTASPVDALDYFIKTDKFKQCFAKQVFRYYMGRNDAPTDEKVLKDMVAFLDEKSDDLLGLIKAMVTSQSFSERK